jgi:hypothetical protein
VAGMAVAFVFDLQFARRERIDQTGAQTLDPFER